MISNLLEHVKNAVKGAEDVKKAVKVTVDLKQAAMNVKKATKSPKDAKKGRERCQRSQDVPEGIHRHQAGGLKVHHGCQEGNEGQCGFL